MSEFSLPTNIQVVDKPIKIDRRKEASKLNAEKARQTKLKKLHDKLQADKELYNNIPKPEPQDEEEEVIYITKQTKPKVVKDLTKEKEEVNKNDDLIKKHQEEKEELKRQMNELKAQMEGIKISTENNKKIDMRNDLINQFRSTLLKF